MTPLMKTFLAFCGIAVLVAGTVSMRSRHVEPAPAQPAQLTAEQKAELAPAPQPVAVSQPQPKADAEIPPPPTDDEPDLEDGNGS